MPTLSLSYLKSITLLVIAYIATAKLGLMLASVHGHVTPAWMPSGIALAALLLGGARLWPGVLLGALLANLNAVLPPHLLFLISVGSTLEALAGMWLMRRFAAGAYRLQHAREALLLMVPVALGTAAIAADVGIYALRQSGTLAAADQAAAWVTWWLGDAVGIACVAPLLLSWRGFEFSRASALRNRGLRRPVKLALTTLAPAMVAAGIFFLLPKNYVWLQPVLVMVVFPVAVWAALDADVRQVTLSNFLVAVVVILGTRLDIGPFSSLADTTLMLQQQGFGYAVAMAALLLVSARAEQRAGVAELQRSQNLFSTVFANGPLPIIISRLADGRLFEVNQAALLLMALTRDTAIGKTTVELGVWESAEIRRSAMDKMRERGRVDSLALSVLRADGERLEVLYSAQIIEFGGEPCVITTLFDLTARKRAELQLGNSERRFADVVEAAGEYVWEADSAGRYLYVSSRIEKVLGFPVAEVIGKTAYDFMPPEEIGRVQAWYKARSDSAAPIHNLEYIAITRDGSRIWQQVSGVPFYAADGKRLGFRGTGVDITERKAAEERIEELATRDLLTQLPNRRLMMDRLSQAILVAQRNQQMIGVLLIDLDRFKVVNDSLGYAIGDALLKQVAARIAALMTEGDTLARVGGDEFVVVLPALRAAEDAVAVTHKIIHSLGAPFDVDGQTLDTSVSIGISVYPNDAIDAATLIRNADMAMSFAKEQRRPGYQYFSPQMNARAVERLSMESTLRRAIENEEFELYYHPKFSLGDGRLSGAEALLRWRHPVLGLMPPARFIAIAEQTGLIVPLGEWVLNQGCAQARAWRDADGGMPVAIAINLSVGQLNRRLARSVHDALQRAGLESRYLELEITESMLMEHADDNIEVLRQLSGLGVKIAIDDFGTGYSSLAYLRRFHIDSVKIDQSFVRDVETSLDAAAIITAVVALGHSLKLKVIAEGVETAAQRALLAELDCDECQGLLFCPPLPAAEFAARYLRR